MLTVHTLSVLSWLDPDDSRSNLLRNRKSYSCCTNFFSYESSPFLRPLDRQINARRDHPATNYRNTILYMRSQKYRAVIIVYVNPFAELCSQYSLMTNKTSNAVLDKALDHSQNITMQGLTTKVVVKNKNNKLQLN